MGVSFETCLRRCEDVPLRRLGDVPLRRHWVFHLRRTCDVTGTYRETSLLRRYDVLLPGGLGILIAGEVEEKEELENMLKWGKFSFHIIVDCEIFTYVKNKK